MSTRCQVIIKNDYGKIWFYRHCDGYPEGVKDSLELFCYMVKKKLLRNNVEQSCGWLVLIGRMEYVGINKIFKLPNYTDDLSDYWKIGSYEPSMKRHGDIEYLYTVDLKSLKVTEVNLGEVFDFSNITDEEITKNPLFFENALNFKQNSI